MADKAKFPHCVVVEIEGAGALDLHFSTREAACALVDAIHGLIQASQLPEDHKDHASSAWIKDHAEFLLAVRAGSVVAAWLEAENG